MGMSMNSKRSYLDTLNAGRQRKVHSSLEELNRTLESLEQRIEHPAAAGRGDFGRPIPRWERAEKPQGRAAARQQDRSYYNLTRDIERVRTQEDGFEAAGKIAGELKNLREDLRHQMTAGLQKEFDSLRKDIERAYVSTSASRNPELGAEFERLSDAIRTLSQRSDDKSINLLRLELEQVKGALDTLARDETNRSSDFDRRWASFEDRYRTDPAIGALQSRLEDINSAVSSLPESLSLRSIEEKVRMLAGAVDQFIRQQDNAGAASFAQIEERLDEISRAIVASSLTAAPQSQDTAAFERVEARISSLARQIEELVEDRPAAEVMERLGVLSRRVDEIAAQGALPERAIEKLAGQVAFIATRLESAPAPLDVDSVLREIEDRFDSLSGVMDRRHGAAMEQGQIVFRDLEARLDDLGRRLEQQQRMIPNTSSLMVAIDERFSDLNDRLEQRQRAVPDNSGLMGAIDERFAELSHRLEQQQRMIPDSSGLMSAIDERFIELGHHLEQQQRANTDSSRLMVAIDERFADLSQRMEKQQRSIPDGSGLMIAIDERFADLARHMESRGASAPVAVSNLEARLEEISAQLEASSAKLAAIDPRLIRDLEKQVASFSYHLSQPAQPLPEFEDLGPRLDEIEKSIIGSRDSVLQAAREAAESAVRSLAGSGVDATVAASLADDLKSLEMLTVRSDERNTKTFEAIHDTLLKIVERLGRLEEDRSGRYARSEPDAPRKQTVDPTPSLVPAMDAPLAGDPQATAIDVSLPSEFAARRSPAEAAAAAAVAAMDGELPEANENQGRVRSMLSGLTRAFSRKDRVEPELSADSLQGIADPVAAEPSLDLDEPLDLPLDPKAVNRPLEPGSGAPDLSAIIRRVRDERGQVSRQGDTETAKSDFIAAARRAAQAAAAEAEIAKRGAEAPEGARRSSLGNMFKARRKPVLMAAAAILIALAGLQLGKAFLKGDPEVAQTAVAPVADTQIAADVPASENDTVAEQDIEADDAVSVADAGSSAGAAPEPSLPDRTVRQIEPLDPTATATPQAPAAADVMEPPVEELVEPTETAGASTPLTDNPAKTETIPADAGPLPLRQAAEEGNPKALFEVGSRYAEGRGVKEDNASAAKWYEKAAELGLAPAQYRIGNFYEKGIGVGRDIAKAKTWYQMAAEQGNASAMHNLAVLYAMGSDGTSDNESAARWFQKAAELGVKDSQFNLGILSAKGVGMPQDLEESYKWFALVARSGDKDASAKRDEIANALRPEQLSKARATTELWKAQPVDPAANTVDVPESWREGVDTTASVDMKQAVRNIQFILNKNGYDAGSADGVMGGKTKQAIAAFQKANGMEATGEVDQNLVKALLEKK